MSSQQKPLRTHIQEAIAAIRDEHGLNITGSYPLQHGTRIIYQHLRSKGVVTTYQEVYVTLGDILGNKLEQDQI